jgi:hypothetical protein
MTARGHGRSSAGGDSARGVGRSRMTARHRYADDHETTNQPTESIMSEKFTFSKELTETELDAVAAGALVNVSNVLNNDNILDNVANNSLNNDLDNNHISVRVL